MTDEEKTAFDRMKWASDFVGVFTRLGFLVVGFQFAKEHWYPNFYLGEPQPLADCLGLGVMAAAFLWAFMFLMVPLSQYARIYWKVRAGKLEEAGQSRGLTGRYLIWVRVRLGYIVIIGMIGVIALAIALEAKYAHT